MSYIENLYKKYAGGDFQFELNVPHLELSGRGITALVGPSGSGKTTFFRCLLGLESCPSLSWKFGEEDVAKLPVEKRKLGVVFQSLELFPHMTASQNIQFAGRARGQPTETTEKRIKELSQQLQIEDILSNRVETLSGGQRQRVALARALVTPVRFLFLDEPFSALDIELRQSARQLVKTVLDASQTPALLITHDPEDVEQLAEHVINIENGQLG